MSLNLLPSQAKFQAAKIRLKTKVKFFLYISAGLWLLAVITIFLVSLIQKQNLNKFEKKLKSEQDQYKSLSGDAILSYQIKYQAKLVGKVLADRFEYGKSIEMINNIFTSNVTLDNYKISGFKQFILEGSMTDGQNMDEVEKTVKAINRGEMEDLESASLNSVMLNPSGIWSFIMEVKLK